MIISIRRWCHPVGHVVLGFPLIIIAHEFLSCVTGIPASQVFSHLSLLDGLNWGFISRWWAVSCLPYCGIKVLAHVHLVMPIVTVWLGGMISHRMVCRIDTVMPLCVIFIRISSICVHILVAWVSSDVVGVCGGPGSFLVWIELGVVLSQVGHAAGVAVNVAFLPVATTSGA